jgi:hypothetical protein
MPIEYRFMPWVRRGLARAHAKPDSAADLNARPLVTVGLTVQADENGAPTAVTGQQTMRLYGPGDIVGIDTRLIVRTDPKPFSTNFEPNYLALIDFDPPDFAWMFSPAKADASQRLRPWLVLIVLDRAKVQLPRLQPGSPLPSITVPAAHAASELPNLADAWMWAHAQAASALNDGAQLAGEMKADPMRNVSRLVAPRRLAPNKDWFACVVPTFAAGRDRGLGIEPTGDPNAPLAVAPAWATPPAGDVTLPVYYHFEFSTGPAGDFETLARRLKTPRAYKLDAELQAKLLKLGTVPVAVDADRLLTTSGQPTQTLFEGALTSTKYVSAPTPEAQVAGKLATIVNAPEDAFNLATGPAPRAPTVAPPIYGAWHARRHTVQTARLGSSVGRWLDELNLDPRFRLGAGYGAALVRKHQELFMQASWAQLGDVLKAERQLAFAALAREALRVMQAKLAKLPDDRLITVLGPARSRIAMAKGGDTVMARVGSTSLPDAIADPGLRRLASPQRSFLKAAARRAGASLPVGAQMAKMFTAFTQAVKNPETIDPNRFVPDGILGTKTFDTLTLPADLNALVDLAPLGLPGKIRAGDIAKMRASKAAATEAFRTRGRPLPSLAKIRAAGLITETHLVRYVELQRAAGVQVPVSVFTAELTRPTLQTAQGVVFSLGSSQGRPVLQAQPATISVTTGAVTPILPVRARTAKKSGALARIAPSDIARFGLDAVLASLPVDAIGLAASAKPRTLELEQATRATVVISPQITATPTTIATPVRPPATTTVATPAVGGPTVVAQPPVTVVTRPPATVTVPPPVRTPAVLDRYAAAFPSYLNLWNDPAASAAVQITPVDFPLASVAVTVRSRTDPGLTVGARIASLLSINGERLGFDPATRALKSVFVDTKLPTIAEAQTRFVLSRFFDRVMAYPQLNEPMSDKLAKYNRNVFLPGADDIPNDFVILLKTNARFVESFLVGLNYEMCRELLWRGFPTDQRGTPFRYFWDRFDDKPDIAPLHLWGASLRLGLQHTAPPLNEQQGSWLVFLIRGQLLRRFPNTIIYAHEKDPTTDKLKEPSGTPAFIKHPIFIGAIPPDITYVGFPINADSEAEIKKWCIVLEEPMTDPRFGFDEPDARRRPWTNALGWKDVDWSQVNVPAGQFLRLANLRRPGLPAGVSANAHAAEVARAMLQRPFRAYFVGASLIPQA